jgi:hypothetical protein
MRLQISTTHEAGLSRVGMDPTENHQIFRIAKVKECALVNCLARVARPLSFRNHKARYEKSIRY